jgi:peptide/nickel transport system substrate-binding protein
MYNSALVMSEQLKAVGINAQLKVVDWPTSVNMALKPDTGWNFFYTGWGTQPALGGLDTVQLLINPNAAYQPKDGKDDPDLLAAWGDMNNQVDPAARQAAFARAQGIILDRVYAVPFGSLTKVQAVRSNVQGFKPFRIPRVSNVWFAN